MTPQAAATGYGVLPVTPGFSTLLSCHKKEGEACTSPKTGSSVAAPTVAAETVFPEDAGP